MNTITLFLKDGQIFRFDKEGTIPELKRRYKIGNKIENTDLIIKANTIE